MRSGELFAGVGGLALAVEDVFDAETAFFVEFDAAPSKVLACRWPDVPNFGDVTKVDWATVPQVDVLAGGFPCQDVSAAGRRRGMKDGTRSGLWAEYLHAIETIRPDWVVIENVRGLYSAPTGGSVDPPRIRRRMVRRRLTLAELPHDPPSGSHIHRCCEPDRRPGPARPDRSRREGPLGDPGEMLSNCWKGSTTRITRTEA